MGRSIKKEKLKDFIGMTAQRYNLQSKNSIETYRKDNSKTLELINSLSSGLSNSLINKTGEGNIVSLTNSKEGLIFVDELEGNTLINRCDSGYKMLYLNGDVDAEGRDVYTTETVDNGLVDAELQGNTMHNIWTTDTYSYTIHADLLPKMKVETTNRSVRFEYLEDLPSQWTVMLIGDAKNIDLLKLNTTYTFVFDVHCNYEFSTGLTIRQGDSLESFGGAAGNQRVFNGQNKIKVTTVGTAPDKIGGQRLYITVSESERKAGRFIRIANVRCFEGDWTDKEVPSEYFEGIKSVGQDSPVTLSSSAYKPNIIANGDLYRLQEDYTPGWDTNLNGTTGAPFWSTYNGGVSFPEIGYHAHVNKSKFGYPVIRYVCENRERWLGISQPVKLKPNTTYTFSLDLYGEEGDLLCYGGFHSKLTDKDKNNFYDGQFSFKTMNKQWKRYTYTFTTSKLLDIYSTSAMYIYGYATIGTIYIKNIKLEEGSEATPFVASDKDPNYNQYDKVSKKSFTLNEPLRSLPNGIKDRYIKMFGEWYIERNCKRIVLTGKEDWSNVLDQNNENTLYFTSSVIDQYLSVEKSRSVAICNNFAWSRIWIESLPASRGFRIEGAGAGIGRDLRFRINKSELETQNADGFSKWLSRNNTEVIFATKEPTYEKVEINPEMTCFADSTFLTNDSFIPCTMKVKNTGYHCILKPSTEYTIMAEVDKAYETLKFNLDGTIQNASNKCMGVITSPSTLNDSQLRISCKGVRAKKIRVIEGNVLNIAPAYFDGKISTFEDNKMSLRSKGINLCDNGESYSNWICENNQNKPYQSITNGFILDNKLNGTSSRIAKNISNMNLKNGQTYMLSFDVKFLQDSKYNDIQTYWYGFGTYYMDHIFSNGKYQASFVYRENMSNLGIYFQGIPEDVRLKAEITNIQIEEGSTINKYQEYTENKVDLNIASSLRSTGMISDRLVIKDNKLMIERNTSVWKMDSSMGCTTGQNEANPNLIYFVINFKDDYLRRIWPFKTACTHLPSCEGHSINYKQVPFENITTYVDNTAEFVGSISKLRFDRQPSAAEVKQWFIDNNVEVIYALANPEYEELPVETSKLLLESYRNANLCLDTIVPPNVKLRYHADIPINTLLTRSEPAVKMNTEDLNQNVIPYLMDMDYRIVEMQLVLETTSSQPALFKDGLISDVYSMLEKDIKTKIYSKAEYQKRLDAYLKAKKLTEKEYELLRGILDNEYKNSN